MSNINDKRGIYYYKSYPLTHLDRTVSTTRRGFSTRPFINKLTAVILLEKSLVLCYIQLMVSINSRAIPKIHGVNWNFRRP